MTAVLPLDLDVALDSAPTLDVVVPVYNEERVLAASLERLHAHLSAHMPFSWRITVVDNGSTDSTTRVAHQAADRLEGIRVLSLDRKGRGWALRTAWTTSDSPVLAYTDVDLSTGLDALLPLVAPLVSGHSDIAIGSRLIGGASVARGPKREFISRIYNLLLRTVFATHFHDAQCGFKAVRADAAAALLPHVVDDEWFFDTELLLVAEHNGLRVHEVPVDWVDDPDSRVRITQTALSDLAGVVRTAWAFLRGGGRIDSDRYRRDVVVDQLGRQLVVFGLIGVMSTAVSAALFLATRHTIGAVAANAIALTSTAAFNAWANRRYTFGRRGRLGRTRDYLLVGTTYVVGLAISTIVLAALGAAGAGATIQFVALLSTWALTTVARFLLLSHSEVLP